MTTATITTGTRVHYTGDMANLSGDGAIVEVNLKGFYGATYILILDDGRKWNMHPGQIKAQEEATRGDRFVMMDGVADVEEIAGLITKHAICEEMRRGAEIAKKETFNGEVERLKADSAYSYLVQDNQAAAKNLRAELKKAFPGIKFSVRKDGWSAIRVTIQSNGPTPKEVERVTDKYEEGHFNGMEDIYEYHETPWNRVFGGVKYVFVSVELD